MGILFILLIYFLGFKKYHVRIKNISAANREELAKVLKYEFGITMAETKAVLESDSYELLAGTFLEASSTKKKVNKTGAKASLFARFFWQKKIANAVIVVKVLKFFVSIIFSFYCLLCCKCNNDLSKNNKNIKKNNRFNIV